MKKFLLILIPLVLSTWGNAQEGCLETQPAYDFPSPLETYTPICSGYHEIIIESGQSGQYSNVQLTAGTSYIFSSSVQTDFVTIGNEDGTVVLATGTEEAIYESPIDQVVRFYTHLDDECNYDVLETFRARMIQCGDIQPDVVNDHCEDAIPLANGENSTGTTAIATNSAGYGAADVFYSYTGTELERVTISLCGSDYDTYMRVYTDCDFNKTIAFDYESCSDGNSELSFISEGNTTYYIMIEGMVNETGNYAISLTTEDAVMPENCEDHSVPIDNIEDGHSFLYKTFADIPVGENALRIKGMNVGTFGDVFGGFTVTLYSDSNGFPGEELQTVSAEIISQEIFAEVFGFNFVNYSIHFEAPFELDANTVYWVQVQSDALGWLFTRADEDLVGRDGILFDPEDGTWESIMAEFSYTLDCEEILNTNDLEKFNFTYYPNPATDVLNFKSDKAIKSISVYNLAGQKVLTNAKISNNQLNLSSLPTGNYVLRAELENGQIETFKIVKK